MDAFKDICYKAQLFLKREAIWEMISYCKLNSKSIHQTFDNENLKLNRREQERLRRFLAIMKCIEKSSTATSALNIIFHQIYSEHFREKGYNDLIIKVLMLLSTYADSIADFLFLLSKTKNVLLGNSINDTDECYHNLLITSTDNFNEISKYIDAAYIVEIE